MMSPSDNAEHMAASVLVVDDDIGTRRSFSRLLTLERFRVYEAADLENALSIATSAVPHVVLSDVRMRTERDGLELLRRLKALHPSVEVILYTGGSQVADAVEAMRFGAHDYMDMPIDPDTIVATVKAAANKHRASVTRDDHSPATVNTDAVAVDPVTRALFERMAQFAKFDRPLLILGESGTGKEVIARAIHARSGRRKAAFVPVNCGAISDTLLESELFGHRRGSFTGAHENRRGLIEEADGGVLFLDEIGDAPPHLQVALLRFLDRGEVRRVGASTDRRVDVRVISATNQPLEENVANGRFRLDLYYRLAVTVLHVPPLRDRPLDMHELASRHLALVSTRLNKPIKGFSDEAMTRMSEYGWPGNVRELQNVVEHAAIVASGDIIAGDDLPPSLGGTRVSVDRAIWDEASEREQLISALRSTAGNHAAAAAALGISRTTLWRRLRRYGLDL